MEIYSKLLDVAKAEQLITYGEIAPLAGLNMESPADRTVISGLLDEINKIETQHRQPMLSSLVVRAVERTPGPGYFVCARDIGKLTASGEIDELEFWAKEVKKVHQYWSHHI